MGRRRKKGRDVHGWLIFDKPLEMTSTQAVGKLRWLFDAKKTGHAGTLDPLATGVLPIAFGEATKTVSFAVDDIKEYEFTVRWGAQTSTDDGEGEVIKTSDKRPSKEEIGAILPDFTGEIEQVPPDFSAIHVNGERAYDLARSGEKVDLPSRVVNIEQLAFNEMVDEDTSSFYITCGKGTYIRSLARDMGLALGCFGHVSVLRRTRVGGFHIDDAISLENLEKIRHSAPDEEILNVLVPVETPLDDIPAIRVDDGNAHSLRNGQPVLVRGKDAPVSAKIAYAMSGAKLVAIGEIKKGSFQPKRVFRLG